MAAVDTAVVVVVIVNFTSLEELPPSTVHDALHAIAVKGIIMHLNHLGRPRRQADP